MKISDGMIKRVCSSMIYKRGMEYFLEGRVHMRIRSNDEITAVVDGDELYNVRVTFENDKIDEVFCTCPYYETMQTTCKHIVAVLKQRQAEIEEGGSFVDENDKLALALCNEFGKKTPAIRLRAAFTLYIKTGINGAVSFGMSVSLPEHGGHLKDLESFLDCYLNYKDYKIERGMVYNRKNMYFSENEEKIITILSEVYETRSAETMLYQRSATQTAFGPAVARRLFPLLANLDFKLVYDGIVMNGIRIIEGDPDIVIDIDAFDKEIVLSVSERGFALTPDGEWFMHSDTIYKTSPEWREYFMPVYRAVSGDGRTQLSFKGDNTIMFAANVLPVIKNRHDVVINGVDELIVNDEPEFEVWFDAVDGRITAAAAVKYGNIRFRIPTENSENNDKIVVRNFEKENKILSYFDNFDREKSVFSLGGDSAIYKFITEKMTDIARDAKISMSDRFKAIKIREDIDLNVSASYKSDIDFLEMDFETELSAEELRGLLSAMRLKYDFFRRVDGSYINLKKNNKETLLRLLERLDLTNEDITAGAKLLPKYHMLYFESAKEINTDESIKKYMAKIRSMDVSIPENLKNVLRQYQKDGVKWLTQLACMGMGGILADDMGLGKTLQVIAYIHGMTPDKPSLIVAPSALTYNWLREIEKFAPDAKALIISGAKEDRKKLIKSVQEYEFVITSYPLLRRDIVEYREIEFFCCIVDEAQYIKNYKTMNAVSVKKIRAQNKFALTGTPIENSLMELWSIFDFVMHGYLKSPREFRDRFEIPAVREGDFSAAENLRAIIKPFVMRRMKTEVLAELPEKIETTMYADLSNEQKAIYYAYLQKVKGKAQGIIREHGSRFIILTLLLRLRQICCHPSLLESGYEGGSGKLELLMELIKSSTGGGHRILVFSQFKSMLDIVAKELEREGYDYFYINGSTPSQERSAMAEEFNNGTRSVFLVSLKAGGTGLNLTGADMVVHYDPWWNPAVTDQATDRAYRIGQTRAVQVIKLAARGTIEEKILKLQERKRLLADDIIRVNTDTFSELTDDEVMSLFEL